MKYYLLLVFVFAMCRTGYGQLAAAHAGDNAITVTLKERGDVAWNQVGKVLVTQGFAVVASDRALGTLVACRPGVSQPSILLVAHLDGNVLLYKGYTGVGAYDTLLGQGIPIVYPKGTSGTMWTAWQRLNTVAEGLGGVGQSSNQP